MHPQSRPARTSQETAVQEQATTRKNERMERRELLYTVVRDAMVRAGVLSASYKFKVLSLDQRGSQFLIMMDVAREFGGDTGRLSEIEALIAQTAKSRYDIAVTAVYWRVNDHVAVGIPLRGSSAAVPAAGAQPRSAGTPVPAPARDVPLMGLRPASPAAAGAVAPPAIPPAVRPLSTVFDPIEADEVAAFRKALGNAAAGSPAGAPRAAPRPDAKRKPTADDFADTEMTGQSAPAPDLGATQYGDL